MAEHPITARELMARHYRPGSQTTNCVVHLGMPIDERPTDCSLCLTDLRNALRRAWAANEWLNEWHDDALAVLTREDAAITLLQGYHLRERSMSYYEVGRLFADPGGDPTCAALFNAEGESEPGTALVENLPPEQAARLLEFFERVIQIADGTVSPVDA